MDSFANDRVVDVKQGEDAVESTMDKNLELLFDYTKFHIGIYISLTTAYIAVATAKDEAAGTGYLAKPDTLLACVTVLCLLLAGMAGGIIVSSITQTNEKNSTDFLSKPLGPWSCKWFLGETWTRIEHTAFWIGLLIAIFSLIFHDNAFLKLIHVL